MLQFAMMVTVATALVAMIMIYLRGRNGSPPTEPESGTLHVTGVSPRPEATGAQYVTISGAISGPSVVAYEVYGRFAWDVNQWPAIGDRIPVVYPTGKPDRWHLSHPGTQSGS